MKSKGMQKVGKHSWPSKRYYGPAFPQSERPLANLRRGGFPVYEWNRRARKPMKSNCRAGGSGWRE